MAFLANQDQVVYGEALETHGFEVLSADNAFGLLSFGLIWEQNDIWSTADQDGTCTWASGEQSVSSTTWTELTGGAWGEN
jgi:hypothetical protein